MKKIITSLSILFLLTVNLHAKLMGGPEVVSIKIDASNPEIIYFKVTGGGIGNKDVISKDGGKSFSTATQSDITQYKWSEKLNSGNRKYVLVESFYLFRSDDGGQNWVKTSASSYIFKQRELAIEKYEKSFYKKYGPRLPKRLMLWHIIFLTYTCTCFLLVFIFLKTQGKVVAVLTGLRCVMVISLFWLLFCGVHFLVMYLTNRQFPWAFYSSTSGWEPSYKLGIVMHIAALPFPLALYLLFLWPILPGSLDILKNKMTGKNRSIAIYLTYFTGIGFVVFNVGMICIGNFWEQWWTNY